MPDELCDDPACPCHECVTIPAEVRFEKYYLPGRVLKDKVWKALVKQA